MSSIIKPTELHKIADDIEATKLREALAKRREQENAANSLRDDFMSNQLRPDVMERVNTAVRKAAAQGLTEIKVMQFPSGYCTDNGRAINNYEASWPNSLQGWAKNAHAFYKEHLEKEGYRLRAEILNYPGGNLGDVGIFLGW